MPCPWGIFAIRPPLARTTLQPRSCFGGDRQSIPKATYAYNPHLPPVSAIPDERPGAADALPQLIAAAGKRPLTSDEQQTLAAALKVHEPWLEWTGKRERPAFSVDPVALHIHERISAVRSRRDRMFLATFLLTRSRTTTKQFSSTSTMWIGRIGLSWATRFRSCRRWRVGRTWRESPDDLHGPTVWDQVRQQLPARGGQTGREG